MELALWTHQAPFGKPLKDLSQAQRRAMIHYLNNKVEKDDAKKASGNGVSWTGNFGTVPPHLRK